MAKPTVLQALLGRPSQSYALPQEKHYFSNKAHLLQIYKPGPPDAPHAYDEPKTEELEKAFNHDDNAFLQPPSLVVPTNDSDDSDTDDTFYTPNSSPRASMVSTKVEDTRRTPIPSTKTWVSSASSVSSVSLDGNSIFSSDSSPSTNITTPFTSESGHESFTNKHPTWHQDAQLLTVPSRQPSVRSTKTPKPARSASARTASSTRSSDPNSAPTRSKSIPRSSTSSRNRPVQSIMTALLELDENAPGTSIPLSSVFISPATRPRVSSSPAYARTQPGHARHRSVPSVTPYNPSIPSSGTPGYTSLTLPRAPAPAFAPNASRTQTSRLNILGNGNEVDLTKSGIAQTTMASVEVVRGLVGLGKSLFHRKQSRTGDVLGFTSYRVPPTSIPANGVLVQVWSVGVDGTDKHLASAETTGFVPGRSFAGRVLECGWEVKDDVARKGDWVVGLLDVRKSGALQEFIVADRHRVYRVPHPLVEGNMSTDELALLPLCGVAAHRAVRTLAVAFGSTSVIPLGDGAIRRFTNDHEQGHIRRALVLRGHDGIGGMAVQMLVNRGWRVSVHAPTLNIEDEEIYMRDVEDRVREWGGEEVVFDDGEGNDAVLRAIERLAVDGDSFDAVLDTIGGKDVWEASQKLLGDKSNKGQFTTLVGDSPQRTIPTAGSHFKAGLRSLRNTHNQEGGKVGYAWVSIAQDIDWEGEDVRQSIGAVLRLAVNEGIRPRVSDIVPFERAPKIFADSLLCNGRTVVVKVVS